MSKPFEEMKKDCQIKWLYGGKSNPSKVFPAFTEKKKKKNYTLVQYRRITSGGGCAMKECRC